MLQGNKHSLKVSSALGVVYAKVPLCLRAMRSPPAPMTPEFGDQSHSRQNAISPVVSFPRRFAFSATPISRVFENFSMV
jgi:hypothetical protein